MENTKEYLTQLYRITFNDYRLAPDENAKQENLKELAKITATATECFGYDFADSLRETVY